MNREEYLKAKERLEEVYRKPIANAKGDWRKQLIAERDRRLNDLDWRLARTSGKENR